MKNEQANAYFSRMGVDKALVNLKPSLELLKELQNMHMLSVPFEDLDIPTQRITLDLEKIFHKIVDLKRGGFCYELNGVFHSLLTCIGYKVDMLSAAVYNTTTMKFGQDFDHLTLLVHLDKRYLVDVGFGDSFREPLELPKGEESDVSGRYRIYQINEKTFEVEKLGSYWIPQYRFTTLPRQFTDFQEMCDFQQDDPTSHFRTRMLCTIATRTGRVTLSDNSLTITEGDRIIKNQVNSPEEFQIQLKKHFDIS